MCKCESVGCTNIAVVELEGKKFCEVCELMSVELETEFYDENSNPFSEDDSSFEGDDDEDYYDPRDWVGSHP